MPIIFQAIDSYNSFWPLKPTIVKAIDAHNYLLTIPMTKIPVLFMIISGKNDFGGFFQFLVAFIVQYLLFSLNLATLLVLVYTTQIITWRII